MQAPGLSWITGSNDSQAPPIPRLHLESPLPGLKPSLGVRSRRARLSAVGGVAPITNPEGGDGADGELNTDQHPLFEVAWRLHRDADETSEQGAGRQAQREPSEQHRPWSTPLFHHKGPTETHAKQRT